MLCVLFAAAPINVVHKKNITATRPYADKLNTILGHLISQMDTEETSSGHNPLLEERELKTCLYHLCFLETVDCAEVSTVNVPFVQPPNVYNTIRDGWCRYNTYMYR